MNNEEKKECAEAITREIEQIAKKYSIYAISVIGIMGDHTKGETAAVGVYQVFDNVPKWHIQALFLKGMFVEQTDKLKAVSTKGVIYQRNG